MSVFELPIVVAPDHLDALGHVNNVVYLQWMQDVAAAHWLATVTEDQHKAVTWVVRRHEIDYRHQAVAGERLIARTWVAGWTAVTSERRVEIRRAEDGRVVLEARSVWVALDPRDGRPRRIDPAVAALFAPGAAQ